jgi:hypothetical protein
MGRPNACRKHLAAGIVSGSKVCAIRDEPLGGHACPLYVRYGNENGTVPSPTISLLVTIPSATAPAVSAAMKKM